jgi:hypothetical protein
VTEGCERYHNGTDYDVRVGNLYGGLIAGRNWWKTNGKWLCDYGLTKSQYDDRLYIDRDDNSLRSRLRRRHHHLPHARLHALRRVCQGLRRPL